MYVSIAQHVQTKTIIIIAFVHHHLVKIKIYILLVIVFEKVVDDHRLTQQHLSVRHTALEANKSKFTYYTEFNKSVENYNKVSNNCL